MAMELGDVVKDKTTGFEGTVVAITKYLYGCRRVSVQPKAINGEWKEAQHLDEPGLVVLQKRTLSTDDQPLG